MSTVGDFAIQTEENGEHCSGWPHRHHAAAGKVSDVGSLAA